MKLVTKSEAERGKHVFAGMWRPPFGSLITDKVVEVLEDQYGRLYYVLPNKNLLKSEEALRAVWMRGDFDEEFYKEP